MADFRKSLKSTFSETMFLKFRSTINLPWGHLRSYKHLDIQTNSHETNRRAYYITEGKMRRGLDLVVEVDYLLEILLPQIYQDLAVEHLGLLVEHQDQVAEH